MKRVGIVGATGYTGAELLRICARHPELEVACVTSRGDAGKQLTSVWPALIDFEDLCFSDPSTAPLHECDLVFFATPNGTAMNLVPKLLDAGGRVVDLSADFRLQSATVWQRWYKVEHTCPELLPEAVYGLPELYRERIRDARIVANPGCYPTAITLAILPLVEAGIINGTRLIADAKSGVSGAGRKGRLDLIYGSVAENFHAYGVAGHRHQPEIEQNIEVAGGRDIAVTFVPHLVPMFRGMHASIYASLNRSGDDLNALFRARYEKEPFVRVDPPSTHPQTRSVVGTNLCRIAVHESSGDDTAIVLSVIDNLTKGAAGLAVQNANLMLGLLETAGLLSPAWVP